MPSLKEVRNRITSVTSTQQITSAMKMVSAAKLRRAQDAIIQMRPYANKLKEILENLSASLDSSEGVYSKERPVKNVLIIAVTSNRGLCGAFNANVIKRTNNLIKNEFASSKVTVLSIGKKANDFYKKSGQANLTLDAGLKVSEIFDGLSFSKAAPIAEKVMEAFAKEQFDKVIVIYNQFKNAAVQNLMQEQLLPIVPPATDNKAKKAATIDYIFEPNKQDIIADLIPRSIKTQFYKALLDSFASEQGARMTAMHKATDNAKEMIRILKINYNKARQASITKEILEIVGGAEALNN